jgi:hypothetical protein
MTVAALQAFLRPREGQTRAGHMGSIAKRGAADASPVVQRPVSRGPKGPCDEQFRLAGR